jgi:glycosyltransferase involved in cell wall biosynthesis
MNTPPFITILTASLNNGARIGSTLESVRGQSFQNLEHIVIDGMSNDNTLDVLTEFSGTYQLHWRSEPDKGIADALNKGLAAAKGRYVLVIQADDRLLHSTVLEKTYSILKTERYDIVSFPVFKFFSSERRRLLRPTRCLWWNHFKFIFLHQGTFVHHRVFDLVGGFRRQFSIAFDYDFFYRALMIGSSVRFERMPIALMGGEGLSSRQDVLRRRIREEALVHLSNEEGPLLRLAQKAFHSLYFPYKTKLLPNVQRKMTKKDRDAVAKHHAQDFGPYKASIHQ